ncbi:MAG: PEP-CTERM sorting domain-containing protein, partial [Acidobacteria bacterium]|nr:PEP-CTERM sorting domain-containing protein [Acidobacteriota bacterium]
WDGSILYSSEAFSGKIDRRLLDGTFLSSFTVAPSTNFGEDMAWDSTRNRLLRVNHFPATLDRINPVTGLLDMSFALPLTGFGFTNLGAIGLAYDSRRDLLYVSFCEAGCASTSVGTILQFDPSTGNQVGGVLFSVSGANSFIGGLAYDAIGDTLWLGGVDVRHTTLAGAPISSFASTYFSDGLELIQSRVPEPNALLLSGLVGIALWLRRRA